MAENRQDAMNASDHGWCGKILKKSMVAKHISFLRDPQG